MHQGRLWRLCATPTQTARICRKWCSFTKIFRQCAGNPDGEVAGEQMGRSGQSKTILIVKGAFEEACSVMQYYVL